LQQLQDALQTYLHLSSVSTNATISTPECTP